MKIYRYPDRNQWAEIVARPHLDTTQLMATVSSVLDDVRQRGDTAVKEYEERFDHVKLSSLTVTEEEMAQAELLVSPELKESIKLAYRNIHTFHEAQYFTPIKVETTPGVICSQRSMPIEKVGLYIPGGTAPLFSTVLMLATPAQIAGCREIVLCTPPTYKPADGTHYSAGIHPAILFAAKVAGVSKIFKAGGVQAIGALAYGTESIPKVHKIFGPGNQYVMAAKQQVSMGDVAIDMPAGPSEVCVIADETSNAAFVAADLISQAEHGIDSQVLFITTDDEMAEKVQREIKLQLEALPRQSIANQALENSRIVLVANKEEAMDLSNLYAPEHLVIQTSDYMVLARKVVNAGSVFLGNYACESAGDYASGTNHTLPTHGYATAYSGVNLDSYCRKITFQLLTAEGVRNIGPTVERMAEAEQLQAHKNAMTLRIREVGETN